MTRLNIELDLDAEDLRAAQARADQGSGLWKLLGLALARITADEATVHLHEDAGCAIVEPDPSLGVRSWECMEHQMLVWPKVSRWVCPATGSHRTHPSAKEAYDAIHLELDPATVPVNQGVHVTCFGDTYIGRVERSPSGVVRVVEDIVGPVVVYRPESGRALGLTGFRRVRPDETKYLGPPRRYV